MNVNLQEACSVQWTVHQHEQTLEINKQDNWSFLYKRNRKLEEKLLNNSEHTGIKVTVY